MAVVIGFGVSVLGAEAPRAGPAAMVLDANTGAILHNDDGDAQRHPASLTKMMTLYLTFETIEEGRMSMSTPGPSQNSANAAPSKLELEPGRKYCPRGDPRADHQIGQ